jgi:hypothetical protein
MYAVQSVGYSESPILYKPLLLTLASPSEPPDGPFSLEFEIRYFVISKPDPFS